MMASPYLHEGEVMQTPAQLTRPDGPEVLTVIVQEDIYKTGGYTRRQHVDDGGNRALIVLYQAINGVHWDIDHIIDVPEHDRLS